MNTPIKPPCTNGSAYFEQSKRLYENEIKTYTDPTYRHVENSLTDNFVDREAEIKERQRKRMQEAAANKHARIIK